MLLPLLLAVTIAHGFTVLMLRRSILTEKISRRGYHLSREYAIDPLEILFVREVAREVEVSLVDEAGAHGVFAYADEPLRMVAYRMAETGVTRLPVVSRQDGASLGIIELSDLLTARRGFSRQNSGASDCWGRERSCARLRRCSAGDRRRTT